MKTQIRIRGNKIHKDDIPLLEAYAAKNLIDKGYDWQMEYDAHEEFTFSDGVKALLVACWNCPEDERSLGFILNLNSSDAETMSMGKYIASEPPSKEEVKQEFAKAKAVLEKIEGPIEEAYKALKAMKFEHYKDAY